MGQITKPNTFTSNTSISSSKMNDNFDTIYNEFNGSISSANLATGAVSTAKIADSAVTAAKLAADTITASKLDANLRAGWSTLGYTPDTITYNGNRSYDLVFNSNDLTDTVSPGMRLQLTRTVTAPTQCADLESGSSNYFNKTSPAGTTFTDDFCVGAWIKLESYTSGSVIISRLNATQGWAFQIDLNGKVTFGGYNASLSNYSQVASAQSVPLGRWVHVAAQLDMSAFTATTTTSYVMIDGLDVPATVARAGTNPTALVQAGNLEVGSYNSGSSPFDGKIAQVWYSSAKITQANIKTLIGQGLTSALISANNIVSAYSLSNSITDLNTNNANNLTAQNSAVATNADSPFGQQFTGTPTGTTEYAIVTQAVFSTNTTITVQVPEGSAIPTSGGVSEVLYSTHRVPYGFPASENKWSISVLGMVSTAGGSLANGSVTQVATLQITVPVGSWDLDHRRSCFFTTAGSIFVVHLSASSSSVADATGYNHLLGSNRIAAGTGVTNQHITGFSANVPANLTTATTLYSVFENISGASRALTTLGGSDTPDYIVARFNYL